MSELQDESQDELRNESQAEGQVESQVESQDEPRTYSTDELQDDFKSRGSALQSPLAYRFAVSFRARLKGLLGGKPSAVALVIAPCSSVHTFGMRYPLDIAFFDTEGRCLRSEHNVRPGLLLSCKRAVFVVERFKSDAPWYEVGTSFNQL